MSKQENIQGGRMQSQRNHLQPGDYKKLQNPYSKSSKSHHGTSGTNPSIREMVTEAVTQLSERRGSTVQAIKKFIGNKYAVDIKELGPSIYKYLIQASEDGSLSRTKGKGAGASFKLGNNDRKKATVSKNREEEPATTSHSNSQRSNVIVEKRKVLIVPKHPCSTSKLTYKTVIVTSKTSTRSTGPIDEMQESSTVSVKMPHCFC